MQNDSYNRGGFYAFVFSIAFSLVFFLWVAVIHPGINLKEVPEKAAGAETTQAAAGGAGGGADIKGIKEPWKDNEQMVAHGKEVYGNVCAVCHGNDGHGNGPAGMGLNPPPRNFVEPKWKNGGDSIAIFKTLQTGIPGSSMVAFTSLPKEDRWALVQFVRSLGKNKVKDDEAKLDAFGPTAQ